MSDSPDRSTNDAYAIGKIIPQKVMEPSAEGACAFCQNTWASLHLKSWNGDGGDSDPDQRLRSKWVEFWRSAAQLQRSADEGCPLCWFLLVETIVRCYQSAQTRCSKRAVEEPEKEFRWDLWIFARAGEHMIRFNGPSLPGRGLISETAKLEFTLVASSGNPTASYVPTRPALRDVASDACMSSCKRWLSTCDASHGCRQIPPAAGYLPRRLLDCDSSRIWNLQLRTTEGLPPSCQYVALSYCWGQGRHLTTTTENLQAHLTTGISLSSLPAAISQAVWVTRRLGVRYLWVDALCIVQDSNEDTHKEIARMAQIYSNAYVTISAAASHASDKRFLFKRSLQGSSGRLPIQMPYICPSGETGTVSLYHKSTQFAEAVKDGEDIHNRAWTLQEHLLSPRLLIFSRLQVFWLCRECHNQDGFSAKAEDYFKAAGLGGGGIGDLTWEDLVEEYASRSLTNGSDRLLACSAIASEFSRRDGEALGRYLCGGWEKTILHDLLWFSAEEAPERIRSEQNTLIFPSWSWVGVKGSIALRGAASKRGGYLYEWSNSFCEVGTVVSCRVVPLFDYAVFGDIRTGEITVEGPLTLARYNTKTWRFDDEEGSGAGRENRTEPRVGQVILDDRLDREAEARTSSSIDSTKEILCLTLATSAPRALTGLSGFSPPDSRVAIGLVVRKVDGHRDGTRYTRMGYFSTAPSDETAARFASGQKAVITLV